MSFHDLVMLIKKSIMVIYSSIFIKKKCKQYGPSLHVNGYSRVTTNTYLGTNVNFNGMLLEGDGKITIGNNFHSGYECMMITTYHNYDKGKTIPYDETNITKEITIKDRYLISLMKQKCDLLEQFQPLFPGLTRNALTKRITEFYKKRGYEGISPTLLAKMIDTRAFNSLPDELKNTMKTLAEFRRHSLDTQAKYYIHN